MRLKLLSEIYIVRLWRNKTWELFWDRVTTLWIVTKWALKAVWILMAAVISVNLVLRLIFLEDEEVPFEWALGTSPRGSLDALVFVPCKLNFKYQSNSYFYVNLFNICTHSTNRKHIWCGHTWHTNLDLLLNIVWQQASIIFIKGPETSSFIIYYTCIRYIS